MTLTNQQILNLASAIEQLDGRREVVLIDGKPVEVWRGYKLSAQTRWNLARNQGKLSGVIAAFHRAKDALIKQHAGGEPAIGPASPQFNPFSEDFRALLQQPVELALTPSDPSDLSDPSNQIPIAVLHALIPILS